MLILPTENTENPEFTFTISSTILPRYTFINNIFLSLKVCLLKREEGSTEWVAVEDEDNAAPSCFLRM